jgi:L,D-transpeptidase-like protein
VTVAVAGLIFAVAAAGGERARAPKHPRHAVARQAITFQFTHWLTVARWAHAVRPEWVRSAPSLHGREITRLHFQTEDGFAEVYLVLKKHVTTNQEVWIKIAVPMRPNGTTGWVPRGGLGPIRGVSTWLVIDRTRLRARFFKGGRPVWQAPVGIGKASTPTPDGLFWVREQFVLPDQVFYGPYAFGTSAYAVLSDWPGGGVVGLHGTSLPQLIPGRPSHGCIRMLNEDILWLAKHMRDGTPVVIVN